MPQQPGVAYIGYPARRLRRSADRPQQLLLAPGTSAIRQTVGPSTRDAENSDSSDGWPTHPRTQAIHARVEKREQFFTQRHATFH